MKICRAGKPLASCYWILASRIYRDNKQQKFTEANSCGNYSEASVRHCGKMRKPRQVSELLGLKSKLCPLHSMIKVSGIAFHISTAYALMDVAFLSQVPGSSSAAAESFHVELGYSIAIASALVGLAVWLAAKYMYAQLTVTCLLLLTEATSGCQNAYRQPEASGL